MTIDINAIEKRCNAASPGPWTAGDHRRRNDFDRLIFSPREVKYANGFAPITIAEARLDTDPLATESPVPQAVANAEFIAHARQDVPALLEEIKRLRSALSELEKSVSAPGIVADWVF